MMLNLKTESPERWLEQVDNHLEEILIDHACENKAARAALNLMMSYIEHEELTVKMTEIVNEELEHFHQVLGMLKKRGIPFRRLSQSNYGRQMKELIRPQEPQRAVDRLLVAALIEARSCERFDLLGTTSMMWSYRISTINCSNQKPVTMQSRNSAEDFAASAKSNYAFRNWQEAKQRLSIEAIRYLACIAKTRHFKDGRNSYD